MEFTEIVKQRYAVKKFDGKTIPDDKIESLLELIKLSPSSLGLQPFKVIIIKSQELKNNLLPATFGQEQITTCSHLLVFVANTDVDSHIQEYVKIMKSQNISEEKIDSMRLMLKNYLSMIPDKLIWAKNQIYIALGNALNGAKSLGFDSCPIEGFNPKEYDRILNLPLNLKSTLVVPVGYASDIPRMKIRLNDDFLFIHKG